MQQLIERLVGLYSNNLDDFWDTFNEEIITQRISFPLLEHGADILWDRISEPQVLDLIPKLVDGEEEGRFVIVSRFLQNHLRLDFDDAVQRAKEVICVGDKWYTCLIVSERVFGYALLGEFDLMMGYLDQFVDHDHPMIKRSVGTAIQYAVKKGIDASKVPLMFELIRRQLKDKNLHVKKGSGLAVKRLLQYYPDFMMTQKAVIYDDPEVNSWHRKKFEEGMMKRKTL